MKNIVKYEKECSRGKISKKACEQLKKKVNKLERRRWEKIKKASYNNKKTNKHKYEIYEKNNQALWTFLKLFIRVVNIYHFYYDSW